MMNKLFLLSGGLLTASGGLATIISVLILCFLYSAAMEKSLYTDGMEWEGEGRMRTTKILHQDRVDALSILRRNVTISVVLSGLVLGGGVTLIVLGKTVFRAA
jgi:hypothetical protein